MDFFTAMEVSASGLSAQRTRMNVSASNLANVNTTSALGGGAYQRKSVLMQSVPDARASGVNGVAVKQIVSDSTPPRMEFDPDHPDADAEGNVFYPNINPVEEMVDMITASRAYEAGVTAMSTAVSMAERALGIGR